MQGKLQETFGWPTVEQLDSVRHTLERLASLDAADRSSTVAAPRFYGHSSDPELEVRAQKVSEKLSENVHIIANEPSLAFYRIQEHVRKTLPPLIDKKREVLSLQKIIQGSCFDTEYAISALKDIQSSQTHFTNIQELLKNAMFMKQQIQYEQERRQMERTRPSMYWPVIRTQTLDVATTTLPGVSTATPPSDRRAQFTRSVHLLTTTSLSQTDDSPRLRSSSLSRVDTVTSDSSATSQRQ
jgi:hypothetical protein